VPRWLFEAGAGFYGWMTTQDVWRQSCHRLVERLPATDRPLRIVDLGCGPGIVARELARCRPRDFVSGMDVASRMLARARCHAAARGRDRAHLTWIQADATQMPFKAESIDAVTGHSVLYLLAEPGAALAECWRVLRPGGRLLVMEPHDGSVRLRDLLTTSRDPRFLLSVALWRPVSWLHRRFGPESLRATLEEAGFGLCDISETLSGLGLVACARKP
jgi:ubiquinone/menaquinone biosynthesis C-methylase UbiE